MKDYPRKSSEHSDSFHTDIWIKDMFPTAFDPCPFNPEWDETNYDGLVDEWDYESGIIFVNPPYSNPLPWVERCLAELFRARMECRKLVIILLVKHDSSTKWYARIHEYGSKFLMIGERLKYGQKRGAAFPSLMVVMNSDN